MFAIAAWRSGPMRGEVSSKALCEADVVEAGVGVLGAFCVELVPEAGAGAAGV